MANDTKKAKPNSTPRSAPEKPHKTEADEDDEILLAGGLTLLHAIFRPRPSRRRGSRP